MRDRVRQRWLVFAIVLLMTAVALVVLLQTRDDGCTDPSVFHLPAGTCISPSSLEVDGERGRVEAAIARYNGSILFTTFGSHHVRFPIDDLTGLDRIKDELTAAGFEVQYSLVLGLQ